MLSEGRGGFVQGVAIYVVLLLMLSHMLKAVVRGYIPYVSVIAIAALGWAAADSFRESLVVFVLLVTFLLPFLTPASRRLGRKIREEDLAYWIAARNGAYPFRRMVAKCIFKWSAIAVLLFASVGMCCYSSKSLGSMCEWVRNRFVKVLLRQRGEIDGMTTSRGDYMKRREICLKTSCQRIGQRRFGRSASSGS